MSNNAVFKSNTGKNLIMEYYDKTMKSCDVTYRSDYVNTSYGRTYIIEAGNKENPPMILLHGSSSNSSMWVGDMKKLSEKYNLFLIDILGEAGKSSDLRLDLKNDDHALWLGEVLDKLNVDKAIFMGNSLGGWMSLKFAVKFPHRVKSLILLATSGISNAKLSFLFKAFPAMMKGEKGISDMNKIVYGSDLIPDEVIEISTLMLRHFNPRMGSLPVFSDEEIKRLNMPVLFMGGEHDALLPTVKTAARLKKLLPHAETIVIKNRGHVIFNILDDIFKFLN